MVNVHCWSPPVLMMTDHVGVNTAFCCTDAIFQKRILLNGLLMVKASGTRLCAVDWFTVERTARELHKSEREQFHFDNGVMVMFIYYFPMNHAPPKIRSVRQNGQQHGTVTDHPLRDFHKPAFCDKAVMHIVGIGGE